MSTAECVALLQAHPTTAPLKGWKRVGIKHTQDHVDRILQSGTTFALVRQIDSDFYVAGVGTDRAQLESGVFAAMVSPTPVSKALPTYKNWSAPGYGDRFWVNDIRQINVAPGVEEKLLRALKEGLDPEYKDHGEDPLLACAASGQTPEHANLLRILVAAGANVNRKANSSTALLEAVSTRSAECVKTLLELGAKPDLASYKKQTPLYCAAERGDEACMRLLLEAGANPDQPSDDGSTPRTAGRGQAASIFAEYDAKKIHQEIDKSNPDHTPRPSTPSKM